MTREEAIEILIAVAVCDRPILSCDFCARYVGIGTHCNYPPDEEIEEAVLLLKGASKDMAISALRQQEHFRGITKMVGPLTNAQKIRAMSDEEIADWVSENRAIKTPCDIICGGDCKAIATIEKSSIERCKEIVMKWLQQPAEEDKHETD